MAVVTGRLNNSDLGSVMTDIQKEIKKKQKRMMMNSKLNPMKKNWMKRISSQE